MSLLDVSAWEALCFRYSRHPIPLSGAYPETDDGFWQYLRDARVVDFVTRKEVLHLGKPSAGRRHGISSALPPRDTWHQTAGLCAVFGTVRRAANRPLGIYNAYRPPAYNNDPAVGGAPSSDHVTNHAIDFRFPDIETFRRVVPVLRGIWDDPLCAASLGIGDGRTPAVHLGLRSPKGHRGWRYVQGKVVRWYDHDLEDFGW